MTKKRNPPKRRNAYAAPAKARRNAGPMTHKEPPRDKPPAVSSCERCGEPLDEGDEGPLCASCGESGDSTKETKSP